MTLQNIFRLRKIKSPILQRAFQDRNHVVAGENLDDMLFLSLWEDNLPWRNLEELVRQHPLILRIALSGSHLTRG